MPTRNLGRRRPPKGAPAVQLGRVLTNIVPAHPGAADHFAEVPTWMLGGNNKYGTCGPTSAANLTVLIRRYLAGRTCTVTDDAVFDLYRRAGNPDFDPTTGAGDGGVDMQTLLEAWHAGGLTITNDDGTTELVKPVAFARVDHTDPDEIRAAVAIFGGVLFGVDLETAQETQTDHGGPWDVDHSADWGGHAVLAGRYTSGTTGTDLSVITWAEIMGTTDGFLATQLDECWVVILPEHLTDPGFIAGVDVTALARDYQALTGRTLPVPPQPPAPAPAPGPDPLGDPDAALAAAIDGWVHLQHRGPNRVVSQALLTWMQAKGIIGTVQVDVPIIALLPSGQQVQIGTMSAQSIITTVAGHSPTV